MARVPGDGLKAKVTVAEVPDHQNEPVLVRNENHGGSERCQADGIERLGMLILRSGMKNQDGFGAGVCIVDPCESWAQILSAYSIPVICLVVLAWGLAATGANGQAVYGSIGGTVIDASGAALWRQR